MAGQRVQPSSDNVGWVMASGLSAVADTLAWNRFLSPRDLRPLPLIPADVFGARAAAQNWDWNFSRGFCTPGDWKDNSVGVSGW